MQNLDYYDLLGLPKDADLTSIKKAYRHQIAKCHPDRQGDSAKAAWLNLAYQTLKNPVSRARYDESLKKPHDGQSMSDHLKDTTRQLEDYLQKSSRWLRAWWTKKQTRTGQCLVDLKTAYVGGLARLTTKQGEMFVRLPPRLRQGQQLFCVTKTTKILVTIQIQDHGVRIENLDVYYKFVLNK